MNILVLNHNDSSFSLRSDSTLIRNMDRYYIPDFVDSLSFSPILYFRCSRPGKSVEERFALRYVDSFGYGILLHPELSPAVTGNREFISSALDFTTLIPVRSHPISDYDVSSSRKSLCIKLNGHETLSGLEHPDNGKIRKAIAEITKYMSMRTGDFITFELTGKTAVAKGQKIDLNEGEDSLTGVLIL